MENYSGISFIFLCMGVIFASGCTSQTVSPESPFVPTPATPIPTTVITPNIPTMTIPDATTTPSVSPSVTPTNTPTPHPDPTDVSEINFLHYSDNDFNVDYPSTWIITKSAYIPYYCKSVLDTSRTDYHVCFENETKSIGPFNFYEDDNIKKQSRIVMFTSADGTLKFISFTSDFLDTMHGNWMLNPTMDWARGEFELMYPDLTASTYISNYKYFKSENVLTSTFDVRLPESSKYYPSAYTRKAIVTLSHFYNFAFITDNENFDQYRNLKDRIISSVRANDMI